MENEVDNLEKEQEEPFVTLNLKIPLALSARIRKAAKIGGLTIKVFVPLILDKSLTELEEKLNEFET